MPHTLHLASVALHVGSADGRIVFKPFVSQHFTRPLVAVKHNYQLQFSRLASLPAAEEFQLSGETVDENGPHFKWYLQDKNEDQLNIQLHLSDHPQLQGAVLDLDFKSKVLRVQLVPKEEQDILSIDPLFHPLSALLLVHLARKNKAFLIHASGVFKNEKGALFTAVSGTGKSTMAQLWQKNGATVINDDRLWIEQVEGRWQMFSTPMVWYAQPALNAPVHQVFLISQAAQNQISPLKRLAASMRVMSNCIQHLYNSKVTDQHLDTVLRFTKEVQLYDCGFKPDQDIVGLIEALP